MNKSKEKINFNYQNLLLQEKLNYSDFNERYIMIQKIAKQSLDTSILNIKNRIELVRVASNSIDITYGNFKVKSRVEKLLLTTNIVFYDEDKFIDDIMNKFNVDINQLLELVNKINELDLNDKDYLNSTVGAWIELYIPNYILIADYYGLKHSKDLILVKLLEIIYLRPEKLSLENRKEKIKFF